MSSQTKVSTVEPSRGKLAVLLPGLGSVGTTVIAGTLAIRNGIAQPTGSLTQMGRLEHDDERSNAPLVRDALPLADLEDLAFGGWDVTGQNCFEAARGADVLEERHLEPIREELEAIEPMEAVFDPDYVPNIDPEHVKQVDSKMEAAERVIADIHEFTEAHGCDRAVSIWCASTEVHRPLGEVHQNLETFEHGLKNNAETISPTMIYAYAHLRAGVPFLVGAPNHTTDCPALIELAERNDVPLAGKDFKTGQTLMKTALAPALAARNLGLDGWYSTNILGNRDGHVLDDPGCFKSKEMSKLSVLEAILEPDRNPALYGDIDHQVRIDYYRPRGDNKEGWDNIDLTGWLEYPMQIKVDFLCRDSILAAPLVLDLALFGDLVNRSDIGGLQEWLSFYFKDPDVPAGQRPVHDLFEQRQMLGEQLLRFRDAS
ncbi:MAG: inositol-3-phosphate synthase [Bradymonadaceae bacterium]